MCIYMYVCAYIFTYVYLCLFYVYAREYPFVYMHVCVYKCIDISIFESMDVYEYLYISTFMGYLMSK